MMEDGILGLCSMRHYVQTTEIVILNVIPAHPSSSLEAIANL